MTTQPIDPETVRAVVLNAHANFERVRSLIEAQPELINVCAPWDETPIQAATHMGNRTIAEWLLERGAPLDVFTAAMLGQRSEVEAFVVADPSLVQARGVHGMPVLWFPVAGDQQEIAAFLLDNGAEINDGAGGNTALHAAAALDRPAMARWLLEHGADPKAVDYEGKTPLTVAGEKNFAAVTAVLASAGR